METCLHIHACHTQKWNWKGKEQLPWRHMYKTRNTGMSQVLLIGTDLRARGELEVDGDAGN